MGFVEKDSILILFREKMNIFRLAGDMTHLASVLVLLLKIHTIKSCAGMFFLISNYDTPFICFSYKC